MHRFFSLVSLLCFFTLTAQDQSASLALRRIEQLSGSGEHLLLQKSILQFLDNNPLHPKADYLKALLFKEYIYERSYGPALNIYEKIQNKNLASSLNLMKWEALYQTAQYEALYEELHSIIPFLPDNQKGAASFYFAESAFREALTLSHYVEGEKKAMELCQQALPFYISITSHPLYGTHAQLAMAEIYRMLGEHEKACSLYLSLSDNAHEKEDLLFHAAVACTQFDRKQACSLFSKIARMRGKYRKEATYQWMQLLASLHQFPELLEHEAHFLDELKEGHLPNFFFYCAMYCTKQELYSKGIPYFEKAFSHGLVYPYDREAILFFAKCALATEDSQRLHTAYSLMEERYPEEGGELSLAYAQFLKKTENFEQALELYQKISIKPFDQKILQEAYREHLNLLIQLERWEEAFAQSERYYPLSNQKECVAQQQIQIALKIANLKGERSHLQQLLEDGLAEKKFPLSSVGENVILLAHCYLDQGNPKASLELLQSHQQTLGTTPSFSTLLTFSLVEAKESYSRIIEAGENALLLGPQDPATARIHLYLFNAYLGEVKNHSEEEKRQKLTELAESHLLEAIPSVPVSLKNRLWLAHRLNRKGRKEKEVESLLSPLFHTPENALKYPEEALVYIHSLLTLEKSKEAIPILKQMMLKRDSLNESLRAQVQLLYATTLQDEGATETSYKIFQELIDNERGEIQGKAQLQRCLLAIQHPELETNQSIVMDSLKDLWTKKCAETEPLHLEAGIEYTLTLCKTQSDPSKRKEYWEELIHHFSQAEDIWSRDYHEALKTNPNKQNLHNTFIRYMRGKLLLEESLTVHSGSDAKNECALQLFQSLTQETGCPQYLKEKAKSEIKRTACR
jgi:hypothetical protein